jgi:putative sterol carrier protein
VSDATAEFFDGLARRGHEPLLEKATGTLRFDIAGADRTEHRLVSVQQGDVTVTSGDGAADCTVRADRALFDGLATGEVNATAAVLRGALEVTGDPGLLVLFQRVFPGPPKGAVT